MPERFRYPPLVELIAELRWGSPLPAARPPNLMMLATGTHEEFFMRFGSRVVALGYEQVERLVPPGFPALPFQAIYRFRKKAAPEQGTTVYQVGTGVFSANITPPYHSWEEFRPVVEDGVRILLETRNPAERELPFTSATLRYIDAFGKQFTEGRSPAVFIREALGFELKPPPAVCDEVAPNGEIRPSIQLQIPLKLGQQMSLALGEGSVSGEEAVVMDITVSNESSIAPNTSDAMVLFHSAHDVCHRVFVGTTRKLSHIMQLVEGGKP
jgi:uncharacterized protein (TIGR04255 family)